MNETLKNFAVQEISSSLSLVSEKQERVFRLMYGRNGGKRSVDDALAMPISDIVKEIPESGLDWAMQQLQNSINRTEKMA